MKDKTEIKLRKVDSAPYKCSATYEWEGYEITRNVGHLSGDRADWSCDLFRGRTFRTLKGLKHAIQLYVDGKLNSINIEWCEEE